MNDIKSTVVKTIVVIILFLLIEIPAYAINQTYKYQMAADGIVFQEMTEEEKAKYSSMALVPDLKDYCLRYQYTQFESPRDGDCVGIVVACKSCDVLPEAYQSVIRATLETGNSIPSRSTIDHVDVSSYTIKTEFPVTDVNDLPPVYREAANSVVDRGYGIWKYRDGSTAFVFWIHYKA